MPDKDNQEITVIILSGKIDAYSSREMETTFNAEIDAGNIRVIVDADKLEYISSAGLRVLLAALKKVKKQQGDIKLACLRPQVKTVFDIAGFSRLFAILDSVEEARNCFQ